MTTRRWKRERVVTTRHGRALAWTDYVSNDLAFRIEQGHDERARLERGEAYALLVRAPSGSYRTPGDGTGYTYRSLGDAKAAAELVARAA